MTPRLATTTGSQTPRLAGTTRLVFSSSRVPLRAGLWLGSALAVAGLVGCAGGDDVDADPTTSGIVLTGSTGNTAGVQTGGTATASSASGSGTASTTGTGTGSGTNMTSSGPSTTSGAGTDTAADDTDGTSTSGTTTSGTTTSGTTTSGTTTTGTTGAEARCRDGVAEGDEQCDLSDFRGKSCADYMAGSAPFTGGSLSCDVQCRVNTSACTRCGDGAKQGTEVCDGADLGGRTCQAEKPGLTGGTLTCNATCDGFDTSGCMGCGNGTQEGAEICDGGVGANTCESEGFPEGGELSCSNACGFDVSNCCGDGTKGSMESCDCAGATCSASQLGNKACTDLEVSPGKKFTGGALSCGASCGFDTSGCTYCGDGVKNDAEECDGTDLGGLTCVDRDFLGQGGTLGCKPDCTFDTSACTGPMCGETLTPQGACPAICDNACAGGVCEIKCGGGFDATKCHGVHWNGGELKCPDNWPCRVVCTDYCSSRTITCPSALGATCEVACLDTFSCWTSTVNCRSTNACGLTQCNYAPGSGSGGFNCNNSCDCQSTCP